MTQFHAEDGLAALNHGNDIITQQWDLTRADIMDGVTVGLEYERAQSSVRNANQMLLTAALGVLPLPSTHGENQENFVAMMPSVLCEPRGGIFLNHFHYLIGQRLAEPQRAGLHRVPMADLLLYRRHYENYPSGSNNVREVADFMVVRTFAHHAAAVTQVMPGRAVISTEDTAKAYSHRTGRLHIGADNAQVIEINRREYQKKSGWSDIKPAKLKPVRFRGSLNDPKDLTELYKRMPSFVAKEIDGDPFADGVSDEAMHSFAVMAHLGVLARRTGKKERMEYAIKKAAQDLRRPRWDRY